MSDFISILFKGDDSLKVSAVAFLIVTVFMYIWGKYTIKNSMYDLEKGCEIEKNTVLINKDKIFQECKSKAEKNIKDWELPTKVSFYLLVVCVFGIIAYKYFKK